MPSAIAITCTACGAKVRFGRERCARCGADARNPRALPVAPPKSAGSRRVAIAAIAVTVISLAGLASWRSVTSAPPDAAEDSTFVSPLAAANAPPSAAAPTAPAANPAVERTPDQPIAVGRTLPRFAGNDAVESGNLDLAIQRYQEALARDAQDVEALNNLGQVFVRVGRAPEAIPLFERAVALQPDRWAIRFNFGNALSEAGQSALAVVQYREAVRLDPNEHSTRYNLGRALRRNGDDLQAVEELKKAIELRPTEPVFYLALGISYEAVAEPGLAVQSYRRYLDLSPSAPDAADVKARVTYLEGLATKGAPSQNPR